MALIKCPECGNEVSTLATNCPSCGCPIKNNPNVVCNTSQITKSNHEEILSFPELPTVMNIGSQITDWGLDAVLRDCYYLQESNHTNYLQEGSTLVAAHSNGISIAGSGLNLNFNIAYEQIIDMKFVSHKQLSSEDKSVIGRAVVGGLLLGPLGAVVGGISGIGSKTVTLGNYYFAINFYDVYTHSIQTILLNSKNEMPQFIQRCMKEKDAHNTPTSNKYICNVLGNDGKIDEAKVIEAVEVVGERNLALEMKKIPNLDKEPMDIIREIGESNNVDTTQYKSSGCMVNILIALSTALMAACSLL